MSSGEIIERYGWEWPATETDLSIELAAYKMGLSPEEGGLGKSRHFLNIVKMLWGRPDIPKQLTIHPWFEQMADRAQQHQWLALAGCASSGKTDFAAAFGLVEYLADPSNTMVFATSTSLKDSRRRIWGSISDLWRGVPGLPGKLVDSIGIIRGVNLSGDLVENRGIALLAGEKSKEKDSIGKLIGFKAPRVIMLMDELPELSFALLEAMTTNLESNDYLKGIGIGNPKSFYDPFGMFAEPLAGWDSISQMEDGWETKMLGENKSPGYCLHFDATKNPNMLAGEVVYPWMLTPEKIEKIAHNTGGTNSPGYWRMVKGFWSPTGAQAAIYSESEIVMAKGNKKVVWREPPTALAALDPSFVTGGDRAIAYFGHLGVSSEGTHTLQFSDWVELTEDITDQTPRNYQIARQFRDLCRDRNVSPLNAGYDWTGGGVPFGDIIYSEWSPDVLGVSFAGAASERVTSISDPTPACNRYKNRVSELWWAGKELLRQEQLRGLDTDTIREMTARSYTTHKTTKNEEGLLFEVEPKKSMKTRIGFSPDLADAAFVLVEVARERLDFSPSGQASVHSEATKSWQSQIRQLGGRSNSRGGSLFRGSSATSRKLTRG